MAKNRTETKSEINLVFQPVLEIADHRTYLNAQADDVKFRKDVIQTQIAVGASETIDFSGKDTYVFTASTFAGDITLILSNLDNGDEKYLIVNKNANQNIFFGNGTNLAEYPARLAALTTLLFRVIQKNGVNYAEVLNNTVGSRPWTNTTIFGEASPNSFYRIDEFGYLEINIQHGVQGVPGTNHTLFTLPAGFKPNKDHILILKTNSGVTNVVGFIIINDFSGNVELYYIADINSGIQKFTNINFYCRIPLSIS